MINRRNFIMNSAVASGLMFLPACMSSKSPKPLKKFGANEKLNVALIGVGGIGGFAISSLLGKPEVNIVAICDVDDQRAEKNLKKLPKLPYFRDFRVMLDKMDKDIDAVVVSTPDHMHYPISAWAIAKGKHVFCQKPLTRTIWEAEELKRLANEAGVVTQMGNQGHTNEGWRLIKEWCDAGTLGEIEDIYIWTNRPVWPQGDLKMPAAQPVPSTLDYNLWLGVAPFQPYNADFLPFKWRGLRNYGTGAAGDMACHFLDVPYSAFDLGYPAEVIGNSTPFNDYSWPSSASSVMTFINKRGANNRIRLHWYDGGRKPKAEEIKRAIPEEIAKQSNATYIVGTKETVYTNEYGQGTCIVPKSHMKELAKGGKLPEKTIARSVTPGNPFMEWALACREGKQPLGNFDYAAPFTEMALLGMVALCVPETVLKYNPATMSFANCPKADKFVRSLYNYKSEFLPSAVNI